MSELIAITAAVLGVLGSACSIAAYAEHRVDKFCQSKRKNKMMKVNKKGR